MARRIPDPSRAPTTARTLWTLLILPVLLTPSLAGGQALRTFTVDDALRVRTVSVADVTDDARWIAATASTAGSRLGTDHFRYGDPTYIGPGRGEVMVIDAESGETRPLFDEPVNVQGVTWSPDGGRLAFRRYGDDGVRLEIWDRASGRVRTVRLRPERELAWGGPLEWLPDGSGLLMGLRTPTWAADARAAYEALEYGPIVVQDASEPFLAWEAVRNRGNLMELALVSLPDGAVRVVAPEAGYQDVRVGPQGDHITYTVATPLKTAYTRNSGETEYETFRQGLAEGAERVAILEKGDRRIRPSFSPDGTTFAWSERGNVFLKGLEADSARNVTEAFRNPLSESDSTKRSFSLERWHPDSRSLLLSAQDGYWLMEEGSEPELVWALPGSTREEWGEAPRPNIVQWTGDGRYLYASRASREIWERGLVRYDLEGQREEVLVMDSDLYRGWTVAEDGSRILVRRSDGDRPDELWVGDGAFRGARALTDMNPWLAEVALSKSRLISYLDVDGDTLKGVLHLPPGYQEGTAVPLVAEIYETFFDNGYNTNAQILAAQGWMMLQPSVDLEIGFPGEAWTKGVTTAINSLMDQGMVDGRRLGVHGTSYGGYATNLIITQTNRFAAAINISGKVNIVSFLGDSEKMGIRNYNAAEESQDRIGATLWEQPQKYWAHSAVLYADRIETPLLLLTGQGDWNVPATNTREMYYALRRLGKEVVWVNYMKAGHGAGRAGSSESDFRDHWARIIDWYDSHFKKAIEEGEGG